MLGKFGGCRGEDSVGVNSRQLLLVTQEEISGSSIGHIYATLPTGMHGRSGEASIRKADVAQWAQHFVRSRG